jgi:hypothetical protein
MKSEYFFDMVGGADGRLSAPMTESHRRKLVDALGTWDFKPHELDDGDLYRVATLLFEAVLSCEGLVELGIDRGEFTLQTEGGADE